MNVSPYGSELLRGGHGTDWSGSGGVPITGCSERQLPWSCALITEPSEDAVRCHDQCVKLLKADPQSFPHFIDTAW
jgi:hypothetical protein